MSFTAGEVSEIRVPGSIANLGPGFDTLAVAVQLYLTLRIERRRGCGELSFIFPNGPLDGENYVERAFRFAASQRASEFPSLSVAVHSDIPTKSGLGSSAAATVAGLRLYELVAGPQPEQGLLNAACALENHPDNVAAALLGGLTVSCQLPDRSVVAVGYDWPESVRFIVLTPEYPLPTVESRKVLPKRVPREDAVFNLQRLGLLLQSVHSGDFSLMREALSDRLHQPYRQKVVRGLADALALEHPDLLGICLSGAGPSIVALAESNVHEVACVLAKTFRQTGLRAVLRTLTAQPRHSPAT